MKGNHAKMKPKKAKVNKEENNRKESSDNQLLFETYAFQNPHCNMAATRYASLPHG